MQLEMNKSFWVMVVSFMILNSPFSSIGQVGVGTVNPSSSAMLDVTSSSKGVLIPRVSLVQRSAITSPVNGLMVYCQDCSPAPGFYAYQGGTWERVGQVVSIDHSFSQVSDSLLPSQKAVKTFVEGKGYLIAEIDGSVTNEIQLLSRKGDTIELSGNGGYFKDSVLTEAEVDAFVADNGYIVIEVDGCATNEIQVLSRVGDTIKLSKNGGWFIDSTDNLGDHAATKNIKLGQYAINRNGSGGLSFQADGTSVISGGLIITGGPSIQESGGGHYLDASGSIQASTNSIMRNWALSTSDYLKGAGYYVVSDARVKQIIGVSDKAHDLSLLKGIEVVDYRMKDTIAEGRSLHKKVIAQQLKDVYPLAVDSTGTRVVPDVMQWGEMEGNRIRLVNHNLEIGDRVKLFTKQTGGIYQITKVGKGFFETDLIANGNVFVYGREVDDFHSVDYEAISMLNVSATQHLSDQLDQITQELKVLNARVQQLEMENRKLREGMRKRLNAKK